MIFKLKHERTIIVVGLNEQQNHHLLSQSLFDRVCRLVELLYKSLLHSRSRLYSALSLRPRANKSQPC
uniref:Uncharacterized protein n=1 Tax=Anguilla anguilla TaxID=7936 RepID=A0A0E9V8Z2_ANGAN